MEIKINDYYQEKYLTIASNRVVKAIARNESITVTVKSDGTSHTLPIEHLKNPSVKGTHEFVDKYNKGQTYTLYNYDIPIVINKASSTETSFNNNEIASQLRTIADKIENNI